MRTNVKCLGKIPYTYGGSQTGTLKGNFVASTPDGTQAYCDFTVNCQPSKKELDWSIISKTEVEPDEQFSIAISNNADPAPTGTVTMKIPGQDDITQEISSYIGFNVKLKESSTITFEYSGDDNYNPKTDSVDITVKPTPTDTWYVNSSATGGDGKTPETAFKTLNDALTNSELQDGNTIMIASGEYKGENNTGLTIDKKLNFIKYGDDDAIFDAESQSRIWNVTATSINITGLTFKNGKEEYHGGAIEFHSESGDCSVTNCNFINNTLISYGNGGAIDFHNTKGDVTNCTFTGNTVGGHGGAINFDKSGSVINCTFTGNTADYGGAIYSHGDVSGNLSSIFINNTASSDGGAIYINEYSSDVVIQDSIFINNNNTIVTKSGNITALNCWFGNNATNYNTKPTPGNVTMNNWLFLNATANPTEINVGDTSAITFKLESYNETSKEISPYDASKMNVIIELSQTLGELNQTIALIGEEVIYTAKQEGTGSVTGKFVTAYYTVNLKNNGTGPTPIPTEIIVNPTSLDLTVGETGTINATLNPPEAGELVFTSSDDKIATVEKDSSGNTVIKAVAEGDAIITVSFPGNAQYAAAENKTVTVTVSDKPSPSKKDLNISASAEPITVGENATVIVTGFVNKGFASGTVTLTVGDKIFNGTIVPYMIGGAIAEIIVSGLNETTTADVNYLGDEFFNPANTTVEIIVNPAPGPDRKNLTISANAEPITVGDNATVVVTGLEDATGNVSVHVGDNYYWGPIVKGTATVIIPGLKDTTTGIVNYAGDDKYNPASTNVVISVNPAPEPDKKNLTLNATAEPITVGENVNIIITGFENATGNVTTVVDGGVCYTPIVDGIVNFTVSGVISNTTAYISYGGDDNYNPANTTVDIIVYPKSDVIIVADDVVKYYGGPERFIANVYDSAMNPIANKSVSIKINGITYNRTTDSNGTVSIAIRLGSGTYNVTTTVDNTTKESMVSVLSTIDGADITKYYKNDTQYSVLVCDATGKAVGEGKVVTFNVNGVFYNRTTDANGVATLNINLPPGEYIITATNPVTGEMQSNKITVLPVLSANDLTMKYLDGSQFKANLVDGQGKPYAEQTIQFNVNGMLYNRVTDSNGQAALNIRLPPGEYIITSSFNGVNVANKITVMGVW